MSSTRDDDTDIEASGEINEQSEDEIIAEAQRHIAEASARKSAKSAKSAAQSVVHKSAPLDTGAGEWEYTVRSGDVLRFPGSVHKVDG